jgi:hypothetical protein
VRWNWRGWRVSIGWGFGGRDGPLDRIRNRRRLVYRGRVERERGGVFRSDSPAAQRDRMSPF